MKQLKHLVCGALGFVILVGSAQAQAASVNNGKATELALHRVERLVIQNKIDASFQTKLSGVSVKVIPPHHGGDPSFEILIAQYPAADGSRRKVMIPIDSTGKAGTQKVTNGGEAANAPAWPEKDSISLFEESLHWLAEQSKTKPEFSAIESALSVVSLTQVTGQGGSLLAQVDLEGKEKEPFLRVRLKTDGTFDSSEFVSRP